ncbi:hypothetical protein UPYG_G00115930 [Umbra pygmaea]|uniref:Uncharacterized protein n=1 Tax=Umbra pygmaea TaxID=75934 RepID=A0ABD0X7V0_UMBPY
MPRLAVSFHLVKRRISEAAPGYSVDSRPTRSYSPFAFFVSVCNETIRRGCSGTLPADQARFINLGLVEKKR